MFQKHEFIITDLADFSVNNFALGVSVSELITFGSFNSTFTQPGTSQSGLSIANSKYLLINGKQTNLYSNRNLFSYLLFVFFFILEFVFFLFFRQSPIWLQMDWNTPKVALFDWIFSKVWAVTIQLIWQLMWQIL